MKKSIIFPLLTLSIFGYFISCKQEAQSEMSTPFERILTDADLAIFNPVTTQVAESDPDAVDDRMCCSVTYNGIVAGPQMEFLVRKINNNSRIRWTFRDLSTNQQVVSTSIPTWLPNCTTINMYFNHIDMACQYFPESGGPFRITLESQNFVPPSSYGTCGAASSGNYTTNPCQ